MRTTKRHMRLRRNQQRTTTHQSKIRNKKIRKSSNHNRRNKRQRHRHKQTSPKNENLLRLRRNSQKRSNTTPRRPPRPSTRIPTKPNGLPRRKHRSTITQTARKTLSRSQQTSMGILQSIREVVNNLKHNRPTPKLCPKCGNPKLRLSTSFDGWFFPEQYVCEQCGYKGPIVLELEKIEETDEAKEAQSGSSKPS